MRGTACRIGFLAQAILVVWAGIALAQQDYPNRPIRFVVPLPGGTGVDVICRIIAARLSPALGKPVIIENRPGAGGLIGAAAVAKATPDGYTFLATSAFSAAPATKTNLPFDPRIDFVGVSQLALMSGVLITSPSSGIKSVKDLVSAAKQRQLTMGSAGVGSYSHLFLERFQSLAGFRTIHVPFKGSTELLTEIMTGRVDFGYAPVVSAIPLIKEGSLVALAVGIKKRASILPAVPTTDEAGVPGSAMDTGSGLWAPGNTDRAIIDRLNREIVQIVRMPDIVEKLHALGAEPWIMSPTEVDEFTSAELALMKELVTSAGIKPE
jgi:tripartite-type tricarboxylate transporter receptor subunit TctC